MKPSHLLAAAALTGLGACSVDARDIAEDHMEAMAVRGQRFCGMKPVGEPVLDEENSIEPYQARLLQAIEPISGPDCVLSQTAGLSGLERTRAFGLPQDFCAVQHATVSEHGDDSKLSLSVFVDCMGSLRASAN